jgi:hypothetical protein
MNMASLHFVAPYVAAAILLISAVWIAVQRISLKRLDEAIRRQARYDALLDGVLMELRDTWDHLPRFIPMDSQWAALARGIGLGLPRLLDAARIAGRDPLCDSWVPSDFAISSYRFEEIDAIVREIGDLTLEELWAKRRLLDLVEILRLALFKTWQPGFDLSPFYREPAN